MLPGRLVATTCNRAVKFGIGVDKTWAVVNAGRTSRMEHNSPKVHSGQSGPEIRDMGFDSTTWNADEYSKGTEQLLLPANPRRPL